MQEFIGVKRIKARPMTRVEYNKYRGWLQPENEEDAPGHLVEYLDGGKSNHPNHKGYISWSPKDVFDNAYREVSGLNFGLAIEAMKLGFKLARSGWNGKDMWIVLMPGMYLPPFTSQSPGEKVNDRTAKHIGEDVPLDTLPYFAMWTANKKWLPGWLASQTDMLSDDWVIID